MGDETWKPFGDMDFHNLHEARRGDANQLKKTDRLTTPPSQGGNKEDEEATKRGAHSRDRDY